METPLSTRRVTRSQAMASATNNSNLLISRKVEGSGKCVTNSRQMSGKKQQHQDRSVLIDITNDSPIVGVALGNLETPSSARSKKRPSSRCGSNGTPGSGEALLRGQVKTLLQKVEEEAVISKISIETIRPFFHSNLHGLVNSPMISLVAPTPANTPQVLNFSTSTTSPPLDEVLVPQKTITEIFDEKGQECAESDDNPITRSLLLDFSEKSDSSSQCSSALTYQGQICEETESSLEKPSTEDDDDDASIWSIQANASSTREDDEEEEEHEKEQRGYNFLGGEYEEEEDYDCGVDDGLVNDLCEGVSKISFHGTAAKFTGKHIRFVYNSDDEEYTQVIDE